MGAREVTYNQRGPNTHLEHSCASFSKRSLQCYWLMLCSLILLGIGASQVHAIRFISNSKN